MARKTKTKFKPVEMELCRVVDKDGDVFIVYNDYTAIYEMHSDDQSIASWLKWTLKPNDAGVMAFHYHLLNKDGSYGKEQCDYEEYDDSNTDSIFENKLVESIQMALLAQDIDQTLRED